MSHEAVATLKLLLRSGAVAAAHEAVATAHYSWRGALPLRAVASLSAKPRLKEVVAAGGVPAGGPAGGADGWAAPAADAAAVGANGASAYGVDGDAAGALALS